MGVFHYDMVVFDNYMVFDYYIVVSHYDMVVFDYYMVFHYSFFRIYVYILGL